MSGSECLTEGQSGSASSSANDSRDSKWRAQTEWLFYSVDSSVFSKPPLLRHLKVWCNRWHFWAPGMLRCSLQISEMSLFRTILVFMLENEEFMFLRWTDNVFPVCTRCSIGESKAATSSRRLIDSVCDDWSWIQLECSGSWSWFQKGSETRTGWRSLFWSYTCGAESTFITGSFYYRRSRKQQDTVASDASFVSCSSSCNISGFQ